MKNIILALLLFPIVINAQIQLNFTTPSDTGVSPRIVTYPNVATYNGLALDMLVCVEGYYSNSPSDTNWYSDVQFRAISGKMNLKVPYVDTFNRCVDLKFKLVLHGTRKCVASSFENTVLDIDGNRNRVEYFYTRLPLTYTTTTPTTIDVQTDTPNVYFYGSNNVNINNMQGSVVFSKNMTCGFNVTYCTVSHNNGGNSDFFIKTLVDSLHIMAIGDVLVDEFAGYGDGCVNYINWQVSKENNLISYEIQYSDSGAGFNSVEYITPKNLGDSVVTYGYHIGVNGSKNYYRLKMIHSNGDVEYSKVIFVESSCDTYKPKVFPNPSKDYINIVSKENIFSLGLINSDGRVIYTSLGINKKILRIDISSLESGVFLLKIIYKNGNTRILNLCKYL